VSERIDNIRKAVEQAVGGLARHVASTPVKHTFRKETVWEGIVETFDVSLHQTVKRCYGLMYREGDEEKYAAIRATDEINSPELAATAFVANQIAR
jgi:hypothetical protein